MWGTPSMSTCRASPAAPASRRRPLDWSSPPWISSPERQRRSKRLWARPDRAFLGETLWYRMVAGGAVPRYVRLCPRLGIAAVLDASNEPALPDGVSHLIAKATVEILTLRPTLSFGLGSPAP